jgi:photosystem II stability/assembly factor-like uncharacterized protein
MGVCTSGSVLRGAIVSVPWLTLARVGLLLAVLVTPGRAWADDDDKEELSKDPTPFNRLKYRNIGPSAGGRVSRSTGVAGNPLIYYTATSSGGVWKTTDAGLTWKPIFDDQPDSSLGAIAVAPSDPNVLYVGGGEANIRGNVMEGHGLYKSTNGGKTWQHVWKQRGQVGHIIVHPKNPNIAFAAVLGRAFGPNFERGVYRTTNGGKDWKQVLSKDADTGAIDVCFDVTNPRVVFAALWQARRQPWGFSSGGPGSGLYRSDDGGDTWKQLKGKGLPDGDWGRVGVAVAPGNGSRVYALIEAKKGGMYRSDDGGDSWDLASDDPNLRVRPWYFSTVHVDPRNADVVYCPNLGLLKSSDGGKHFKKVKGPHHGDHHDLWIDPKDPQRMIDSNDGGVDLTTNGGATWYWPPMPISQFYHVNADNRTPYHVMGNLQDIGTAAGPSNSLSTAGIQLADWYSVGGGETGFSVPDPSDPNVVYAGEYGGTLTRFDRRTRQARNVSAYPFNGSGFGAEDLKVRFQWTAPVMISPHDSKTVYHGANVLFRTQDGGKTWKAISPDLTRDDKSKQKFSGGPLTGDNTGAEVYCTIFAIAESPKQAGVLWAGSDDGLVHVSRDGGKSWDNVTKNIPGMPNWGTVVCIEASPFDAATAYVVVDNHRNNDVTPYLYRTSDFGKTWKSLTGKIGVEDYLHVVREDPLSKGLLFAGSETGVLFSPDDGATWLPLKLNMPTVAVHDLQVKNNDLVVGTHGRSVWILDDLTPVRQMRKYVTQKEKDYPEVIWFKEVPAAVRWRYHAPVHSTEDRHAAPNPPKGAVLHYYLRGPAKALTLDVLDANGKLVRQFTSKKADPEANPDEAMPEEDPDADDDDKPVKLSTKAGLHRVVWDLHHEGAKTIPGAKIDNGNPRVGPLVNPGKYTVRLKVDGKEFPAAPVEVLPDPRTKFGEKELAEQLELALKVRDDISHLTALVKGMRSVKKQIENRQDVLRGDAKAKALLKAGKALVEKLDGIEGKLHNPKAKVVYDILAQKGGAKLYSQLANTLENLRDADGAPTQGVREVYADFARELRQLDGEVRKLFGGELVELNDAARKGEFPTVVAPKLPAAP